MEQSQFPSDTSPQRPPENRGQETVETNAPAEKEEWPQLLPESWKIPHASARWYERPNDFTAEEKKKAWDETAKIVKDYSDELVKRWKEEIDTLLVYAGLFSAVLTALIVESYKLLSPSPPDPVLAALQQISVQLSSFSVNPSFVNSTQPSVSQALPPAPPAPRWAVWLNALWFSSLIFSLSAASVGIMVKQWLNEYSTGLFGDSRHFARLRQHRLQNLEKWHVAGIVAILPVLLQIALALFFGGLLVLLWNLNSDVAAVASALVSLLFSFTIGTLLVPLFRADCCFLSPPVYAFLYALRPAKAAFFRFCLFMCNMFRHVRRLLKSSDDGRETFSSWVQRNWEHKPWNSTWRGRELEQISRSPFVLDAAMVSQAYATTMYQPYLDDYATICFSDFLTPSQVVDCYRGLVSEMDRQQQDKADIPLTIQSDLWLATKFATEDHCSMDRDGLADMERFWEDTYNKWRIPTGASSHWRNHLWANALFEGNTSVAYQEVISAWSWNIKYDHFSNAVRQRAVHVVEQELRKHGQKADNESLSRCSGGLYMLLDWVGATSSAKDTEEIETVKVIRALTRHGLICHFKCYTTEAGKTLSLYDNITGTLISKLRTLREDRGPDFMTPELVDALVRVYEVHQDEFHRYWRLSETRRWIMKLKRERDESTKNDHVQTGISLAEAQLSAAADDRRDPTAAAQVSVVEQPHSNTHTSLVQDVHAEETEKEIATNTPSPVLSPSSD